MELYTSHGAIISTAMLLVSDSILGKLYTYTPDGIRSSKTVNGTKTEYLLNGTQILAQKTGSDVMWFFYDSTGTRIGVQQGNVTAYYMYNLQGDVVGLADAATGKIIAKYLYDAWGKCVSVENADGYTIGTANPFRYRGYYYDNDTGLYYLQSRYYDPAIGRFINADTYTTTDADGLLSTNMFAYCENNPVNMSDETGTVPSWLKKVGAAVAVVAGVAAVAAITVATAGAGTAAAVIAVGAAKGAAIGMASGAISGAAIGAASHIRSTGSWKGAGAAALNGMGDGALSGAVTGAVTGAAVNTIRVGQAAKAWDASSKGGPWKNMSDHYSRHVLKEGKKSMTRNVITYTNDAKALWVNSNGTGKLMSSGSLRLKGSGVGGFYSPSGLIRSFFYQ